MEQKISPGSAFPNPNSAIVLKNGALLHIFKHINQRDFVGDHHHVFRRPPKIPVGDRIIN